MFAAQIPQQVHHEERAPLGLGVHEPRERRREAVVRILELEKSVDVFAGQEPQCHLAAEAGGLQLQLQGPKGMLS